MIEFPPTGNEVASYNAFNLLAAQICVVDQEGLILFVNQSWVSFSEENAYHGASFIGQSYVSVCACAEGAEETMASSFALRLREVLEEKQSRFSMVYPCHSPKTKRWFKATVQRNELGTVIMHTDISEEYQKLERTSGLLSKAEIIHDLRSPLNAIIGFADLALILRNEEDLTEKFREYFGTIRKSGGRMLDIVNDLLNYVSQVRGDTVLHEQVVNVKDLINEVFNEQKPLADKMNVSLKLSANSPLPLLADEKKLWKVLSNLITNGIKYNRQNGELRAFVDVNVSHGLEITLQDTGIGMKNDRLFEMFEPFSRELRKTTSDLPEGTGVGLAVVREIIHQHDGVIKASSAENLGTSITLIFPSWRTHISTEASPIKAKS